jgi:hypothetical protein
MEPDAEWRRARIIGGGASKRPIDARLANIRRIAGQPG